jgi:hypothetical protein
MALSGMASKELAFSVLERDRSRDRAWRLCPVLRRTAGQIQEKLCPVRPETPGSRIVQRNASSTGQYRNVVGSMDRGPCDQTR